MPLLQELTLTVHNEKHTIKLADIKPETTLLEYLREYEHLKGTKYMCLEGGCGACIVAITTQHPLTKRTVTFAVNSCLVSVYSCQGWEIHTVDGIGNKSIGYNPIQKVLAQFNGTQCGFCSPGMVMNMYALYQTGDLTMKKIEDSFDGNICRCTGYRSILTAFKSLANDADSKILGECADIEEVEKCVGRGTNCHGKCQSVCKKQSFALNYFTTATSKWFKVYTINEIFDVFRDNPGKTYQLVGGNTAKGVYPQDIGFDIYIDITSVSNLLNDAVTTLHVIVGANKTLNDTIQFFQKTAKSSSRFSYLNKVADHIKMVANVPVRNIGTLAGNLSTKHEHNEFPSDIFLVLEAVGAVLTIVDSLKIERRKTPLEYLSFDMRRKVIKNIYLPSLNDSYKYGSYKIMPRAQNAHAMVNAGFLLKLDRHQIVESARIVYGGISSTFVHASTAEHYLIGKHLFDNATLQGTFNALNKDIHPEDILPEPSPKFRKDLAISLFYKFVLSIAPLNVLSPANISGGLMLTRPVSTGVQDFQSNKSLYPLTKPIPKLEALGQTSGEVEYITDIPNSVEQLFAYFVTAKAVAYSVITNIDPSEALKLDGVIAFFGKNDIPGPNTFIPKDAHYPDGFIPPPLHVVPEELFCSGIVKYYFQPLGIIVAKTQDLAEKAAELVKVTYSPGKTKPLFTIQEILKAGATNRITNEGISNPTRKGTDIKHIVKGTFSTSWQYHFHMETHNCVVIPEEDCLNIYPNTQWIDLIQTAVANLLNIAENKINVVVKRLGGAFGAKITRSSLIACGTALAAYKLQKPVRMRMTLTTNMNVVGKRSPSFADYEVALNDKGEIQYLNTTLYLDYASGGNDPIVGNTMGTFYSSYKHDTWYVSGNSTKTDNHASSYMRAPGNATILPMIETIMEHIAMQLNKSPVEIRIINMDPVENRKIIQYVNELLLWAEYDNRKAAVDSFNKASRWTKRALSVVPMTYPIVYDSNASCTVVIFAGDGSVAITHGGIEMGQGINTKVTQVVAWAFGIPLDMISVKSSNNMASPNNFATGGSITSEKVCYAALRACDTLLERMKPIKEKLKNPTWQEVVKQSQLDYVELIASHMFSPNDPVQSYYVYGVCATEVEVDILTGLHQVTRVDLLEDTGNSISPLIDIGQVEGAFIMGLGFWTTEKTAFTKDGQILTNRTWNYDPPVALDIPIDFRVKFPKNNPNPNGILHSKTAAEPPLCLACSIPIAIRQAVASARTAADPTASKWYPIDGPSTVENTFLNSLNDYKQFTL